MLEEILQKVKYYEEKLSNLETSLLVLIADQSKDVIERAAARRVLRRRGGKKQNRGKTRGKGAAIRGA